MPDGASGGPEPWENEGQPPDPRSIRIEENVLGSILTTGDGNIINATIQVIHPAAQRDDAPPGANPYKGLAAFNENDAERYFGREAEVARLRQRLQDLWADAATPRVLPVLGPSGCGKSSLVRAGLIPQLVRQPLPGYERLQVAVLRPGARPLEALARVLAQTVTADPAPLAKTAEFEQVLGQPAAGQYDGLRRIVEFIPDIQTAPLVLLVDQFEEVYSLCKDAAARQAFIDTLLHAASDPGGSVAVVFTLRSDFLGETQGHSQLTRLIGSDRSVLVPAMAAENLRRAILEPARRAGRPLAEAVVDRLILDTEGRQGALPLLQFALTRIWEEMGQGRDAADAYWAMGRVGGALAHRAQEIYDRLQPPQRQLAERIFVELAELGENGRYTRRQVVVDTLVRPQDSLAAINAVMREFAQPGARLVTLLENDRREVAEVTHEALFDHWQALKNWLADSQEEIRFQRQLDEAAQRWLGARCHSGHLWRDPEYLGRLKRTVARRGEAALTIHQAQFYKACLRLEKRERLAKLAACGAVGIILGLSWFSSWRIRQEKQVTEAVFLGDGNTAAILANLPRLKGNADALRQRLDTAAEAAALAHYQAHEADFKRLFAYYRNIITVVGRLQQADPTLALPVAAAAEAQLAQLIAKYRLPELQRQLAAEAYGEFRLEPAADPQQLHTPGALATTYAILMTETGAGADLNHDGVIGDAQEAQQLPCDILAAMERLWRQATDTCSWYTADGPYAYDPDCQALSTDRSTLYTSVFDYGADYAMERIRACGIPPG